MVRTIEGSMNADGIRFAIVASRFNGLIVGKTPRGRNGYTTAARRQNG